MKVNENKNEKLLDIFEDILLDNSIENYGEYNNKLSIMEIDDIDYIGIINILKDNLLLPVESNCNKSFINVSSACSYFNHSFVIIGTIFKDSFFNYKLYNINDIIVFINMFGQKFKYKITEVERVNKLDEILQYSGDLIIVIRDYYNMKYVLFICNM